MSEVRNLTDAEWLVLSPESGPIIVATLRFVRQWPTWKRIVFWRRYRRAWDEFNVQMLRLLEGERP